MWQQITLNRALRAFLRGKTVKVVDLSADVILPLSEVLERFQQGAMLMMETDGIEETVEEDPEQLMKKNAELMEQVRQLTEEYGDLNVRYAELDAAYQVAQNPAPAQNIEQDVEQIIEQVAPDCVTTAPPSISVTSEIPAEDAPPAKKKRRYSHDTVDEMEAAYQKRGISDIPKLQALRKAGWNMSKIADEFGCCPQTVANTMKREGIE